MTRIKNEIHIDAPQEQVWDILADLGGIKNYNPSVTNSYYLPGEKRGIGAARHCDLKPFGSVEETAIQWDEGRSYTPLLHDGKKVPPFKKATGRLAVRSNGSGTVASMTLEYDLKYGPLGKLMDLVMVRSQFQKVIPTVLDGLKKYAELQQVAD